MGYLGEFKFYQVFFTVSKQIINSTLCEAARAVSDRFVPHFATDFFFFLNSLYFNSWYSWML